MRYEAVEKKGRCSAKESFISWAAVSVVTRPSINGPVSVTSKVLSMLPETENIQKVYSLDIHLDIQLNIGLGIHYVLYIFGVCVKRILKFIMRHELTKEKGRCFVKRVLYLLGVRNVVTIIEREVMIRRG